MAALLHLAWFFLFLQLILSLSPASFSCAAVTGINAFTVVVVEERAAERLRRAPAGAFLQIPPYVVQLSSNWTVVEKNVWSNEPLDGGEGQLLHCRLPLPQTVEAVALREKIYMDRHREEVRAALWRWLMGSTQQDGCVFGDGEGQLTGVSEWYLFCPRGLIRKVNQTAVKALSDVSASQLPREVRKLMQRYRHGGEKMGRAQELDEWTYVIGEYDEYLTQPRWGLDRRAWELFYPTNRPCDDARQAEASASSTEGRSEEENPRRKVWETVVRINCQPGRKKNNWLHEWAITEVRQSCRYEINFLSPVVCEWEENLERVKVNPIPCISL